MPTFKLTEAPTTIRPRSQLLAAATMPRGKNAKPEKVTEVELLLEVEVDNCIKETEYLFPDAKKYCDMVASLEHAAGEDRITRTKLPEMNVVISYDGEVIFDQLNCPVKARPQLKVDKKGEAKLILKPRIKATGKELALIAGFIDADVRLSMEPTQTDLSEDGALVTPVTMVREKEVQTAVDRKSVV